MNIKTKFNFKDKVYPIHRTSMNRWITCSFCNGERAITGYNNTSRSCPECYGKGGYNQHVKKAWQINDFFFTIGEVQITKRCEHMVEEIDNLFDNYGSQKAKYEEKYMCYETGIGTGTVWLAENLFYSKEKGQEECDKRNLKEKEN